MEENLFFIEIEMFEVNINEVVFGYNNVERIEDVVQNDIGDLYFEIRVVSLVLLSFDFIEKSYVMVDEGKVEDNLLVLVSCKIDMVVNVENVEEG